MASRPRILIADDHKLVADLCKSLLDKDFDVVRTVANGRDLVSAGNELRPDVIVVDIGMPLLNGLDAVKQIKTTLHGVKILFLTMNPDPELALEALERGASGYLLKTCAASEMVIAVRDILRGKSFISQSLKESINYLRWQRKQPTEEAHRLTERQREVLQLLAEGKVMKEIGHTLHMTTRTVAFHKYRIMEVLGAKSSAELVRYAIRNHIIAA